MSEPTRIVPVGPAAAHVKAPPPPGFTLVHVTAKATEIGSARHTHAAAMRRVHAGRLGGRGAKEARPYRRIRAGPSQTCGARRAGPAQACSKRRQTAAREALV